MHPPFLYMTKVTRQKQHINSTRKINFIILRSNCKHTQLLRLALTYSSNMPVVLLRYTPWYTSCALYQRHGTWTAWRLHALTAPTAEGLRPLQNKSSDPSIIKYLSNSSHSHAAFVWVAALLLREISVGYDIKDYAWPDTILWAICSRAESTSKAYCTVCMVG